jgi:uncharacterized membrane protein
METPNKPYESRVRKSTLKLFYWTVAWLLATALLAFGDKFLWQEGNTVLAVIAFAIAVLVGIGMVIANKNYLKDLDELHQKVMLEAMGITLGVPLAVGMPYTLLIEAGVAPSEDWFAYLLILMSLTFMASFIAGLRRYK